MELDIPNTDARSAATVDLVLDNLNQFQTEDGVFSETFMIRNLPWRILVMKKYSNENESNRPSFSLGFFLQCNGESENLSWNLFTRAKLTLLSQTTDVEDFSRTISHKFNSKESDWGFSQFISWEEVMNPECGYIKDDSIILRAEIFTDPPSGIKVIPDLKLENVSVEDACIVEDEALIEMDYEELDAESKIEYLEEELSQMKIELVDAKTNNETLSAELTICRSSIAALESKVDFLEQMLKSKFDEMNKKLNEFSPESLEMINVQSTITTLESKIGKMDDKLKAKFEEVDQKISDSPNQSKNEKEGVGFDVNITARGIDSKNEHSKRYSF